MRDTSGMYTSRGRTVRTLLKLSGSSGLFFSLAQCYWDSYQFSWRVRHHHLLKHWTPSASQSVNRWEDAVQMRRTPQSFSRFSTRDSYIALSCVLKDEPAFKPLQGNPTFNRVMISEYPLYLMQKTQGSSHIPIAEGKLLLRCLWKAGLLLQ